MCVCGGGGAHHCFRVRAGCVCEGDYRSGVGVVWLCGWLCFFHVVGIVGNDKQHLAYRFLREWEEATLYFVGFAF